MDPELLIALCVLWISTTASLCAFLPMWVANDGEAFHPHCVCVDQRHSLFLVVSSETICKVDCTVASISSFVAPRGSSASKNFTVLCIAVAVSGFLGSVRWAAVGDAKGVELMLALIGFSSLIFTSLFELDVSPQRFLEDKLLVTGWLLEKLGYSRKLSPYFKLHSTSQGLLEFLRASPEVYWLYQEDHNWRQDAARALSQHRLFTYNRLWRSAHISGAVSFVVCVTTSILLNDAAEEKVAWIAGGSFFLFCFLGWLSGVYVPLFPFLKGYLLLWNPFFFEPYFMLKLKISVEAFLARQEAAEAESKRPAKASRGRRKKVCESKSTDKATTPVVAVVVPMRTCMCCHAPQAVQSLGGQDAIVAEAPVDLAASLEADLALDNPLLRMARQHPARYLRLVGHLLIFSELIALLTPAIAMGIQWITALCDGPPDLVIIDLLWSVCKCFATGDWALAGLMSDAALPHCILKKG